MRNTTPQRAKGVRQEQSEPDLPDLKPAFDAIAAAASHRDLAKLLQQAKDQHAQLPQATDDDG